MATKTTTGNPLPDYNDIFQKQQAALQPQQDAAIAASDAMYDAQGNIIKNDYAGQIAEGKTQYDAAYRENAVQKKVNEFKIAEDMANMGLTNSGLSRMQVTANNLSYANQKGAITVQKQRMVDSLTREMNNVLAQLNIEKAGAAQGIKDRYLSLATSSAGTIYNTENSDYWNSQNMEYQRERDKVADEQWEKSYNHQLNRDEIEDAQWEKSFNHQVEQDNNANTLSLAKLNNTSSGSGSSGSSGGSNTNKDGIYKYSHRITDDNGVEYSVYYKDGKEYKFPVGTNPYTNDKNNQKSVDKSIATAIDKYGTFQNGYQPAGVVNELADSKLNKSGITDYVNGNLQNVWIADNDTFWIWDGKKNKYLLWQK